MQRTYRLRLKSAVAIPEAARQRMFALGRKWQFADGQFVFHQGDAARGFYAVVSGQVMVGRYAPDGSLAVYGVAGSGDLVGELAFFAGAPRLSDCVADGPVELVEFDKAIFKRVIMIDPEMTMILIRSLAGQLKVALERIDADRTLTLPDRLAQALLGMEADSDADVACTQQQLADLIGVSRVSLGSALRQLEKSGAVAGSYGRIRIVDRALLEARFASINRAGDAKAA